MTDIKAIIARIEELLAQRTPQATTYAALECRLAIEKVCYERLKIAHDYISHEDLRGWQPQHVVRSLLADLDAHIASTVVVSIGSKPFKDQSTTPATVEDFKDVEWLKVGTQVGFDPGLLGSLWNSLARLALHVHLPQTKDEIIPAY